MINKQLSLVFICRITCIYLWTTSCDLNTLDVTVQNITALIL